MLNAEQDLSQITERLKPFIKQLARKNHSPEEPEERDTLSSVTDNTTCIMTFCRNHPRLGLSDRGCPGLRMELLTFKGCPRGDPQQAKLHQSRQEQQIGDQRHHQSKGQKAPKHPGG